MIVEEVVLAGIIGAVVGSFLATVAIRALRGGTALHGRSCCDACGAAIPAWMLLPIASYALLRGRCRMCGGRIDWRHPVTEAVGAMIGATALAVAPGAAGCAGALFGWLLVVPVLTDLDALWLPDTAVLPLAIAGLAVGATGLDPSMTDRLLGGACGFALLSGIGWAYHRARGRDGIGGGDAKLLAAVGCWLGWQTLPWVLLSAASLGLGCVFLLKLSDRSVGLTDKLPLGSFIALSAWPLWMLFEAS